MAAAPAAACIPPGPKDARLAAKLPELARVASVTDGDTVTFENGLELRLVGVQAPKLALGRKGFVDWPLAHDAKKELERLVLGRSVRLHPGTTPFDRYGRALAQAYLDRQWIQGAMLDRGMARVYTFKDNRGCAAALLARERAARAAGLGIWALETYAIRKAGALGRGDQGRFVLVEGRISAVAAFRNRAYLNYGSDYRTDFTAVIEGSDLALFRAEGYDLKALGGQPVRVRGWLQMLNGPMIAISHPEQIEPLREAPAGE